MTTQDAQEYLWTDELMYAVTWSEPKDGTHNHVNQVMRHIRDDYETLLANVMDERDAALQQLAECRQELADIERWELDDPIEDDDEGSEGDDES